jgi:hypothetical protein
VPGRPLRVDRRTGTLDLTGLGSGALHATVVVG